MVRDRRLRSITGATGPVSGVAPTTRNRSATPRGNRVAGRVRTNDVSNDCDVPADTM